MAIEKEEWIELQVIEAKSRDVIRGKIRISNDAMKELGITTGDIVEIQGSRSTAAVAWPSFPEDVNYKVIRMDAVIRDNAGVKLQDKVKIRKATTNPTQQLVLAPKSSDFHVEQEFVKVMRKRLNGYPLTENDTVMIPILGKALPFVVVSMEPKGITLINDDTRIEISNKVASDHLSAHDDISYEDIGGLDEIIQKIKEMIELPLRHPILFETLGIEPPKGVLIHGPPGTGKTLIARAVASETQANFVTINGPEIMSKYYGESEKRLRAIFKKAEEQAPTIIFLDEIDSIAPSRESTSGEVERRVVAQLLALMDGMGGRNQVIVIGATNRVNSVDPALRRPGRFDREIEIGVPNQAGRYEILKIHTNKSPLAEDVNLIRLSEQTHGMVGADLKALSREAAMHTLRRFLPEMDLDVDVIPDEVLDRMEVTQGDFINAAKEVTPSALREVFVTVPNVTYMDIGGLDDIIQQLKETVEWPIKHPEAFKRIGITPPGGVLLYGPPGTGKTLIAKAVANESEANFISIKGPELLNKWVGESEKGIREVFRKARQASPTVIFFDEIDSIATRRGSHGDNNVTERMISQLLTEIDGLEALNNVIVIASTNRPDMIDPALMRPGRFDRLVHVKPPNLDGRIEILKIFTDKMPLADDVNITELAKELEYFVGSDIEALCREAAIIALRVDILNANEVCHDHFVRAKDKVHATMTPQAVEHYQKIEDSLKRKRSKLAKSITADFT
ncbi:MAG: CDC48 family AAA ATPase [Candidatus Heimdallarchaeota archaeon]|nr:CDC48 family AAA ATPase [Candidatus Heimdallarchaeota archaeon]